MTETILDLIKKFEDDVFLDNFVFFVNYNNIRYFVKCYRFRGFLRVDIIDEEMVKLREKIFEIKSDENIFEGEGCDA